MWKWDEWAAETIKKFPHIMGHEFSGVVAEVGRDVRKVREGDYVSAETHIYCGHCYQCMTNRRYICRNLEILGVHRNGCFADYLVVPEQNLWINSSSIPPEIASIQEPLGNAVDTVLAEDVSGKTVAVLGCGPIGLMAIAVARVSGANKIFATEITDYRLGFAEKMGADFSLNPLQIDVVDEVMRETGGKGVDVVLEMSGSPEALKQGLKMLTPGGRISLLGLPTKEVSIDLTNEVIFKGVRIYGVTGRKIFSTWFKVSRFLGNKLIDLKPLITHKFPFREFERGMHLLSRGEAVKVVLFP